MKPIFYAYMIAVLVLSACSSGKSTFERGNYYEAVITSVNRLRRNDDHKKSVETLRLAYPMAVRFYEDRANTAIASTEPFKWSQVVNSYTSINNMYDEIRRCPGALRVIPEPVNYFSKLQEARQNAAEEYYAAGIVALQFNEREKAKQAYGYFKTTNEFVPGYKEVISYMEAALSAATVKILVEPIPVHSKTVGVSADFFNDKISEFVHSAPISEFVKFYSRAEAEKLKLKPDHIIQLEFDEFTVGQVYKHEKEIHLTKDSVVMGTYFTPSTASEQPASETSSSARSAFIAQGTGVLATTQQPATANTNTSTSTNTNTQASTAAAEQAEKARIAREAAEKRQAEAEKALADKLRAEREAAERQRIAREAAEKAAAGKALADKERLAKEQADRALAAQTQAAKEKAAQDAAASQAVEQARIEAAEKAKAEAAEKARLEAAEKARLEAAEKARLEAAEKARLEKENAEREKAERERLEKERVEKEAAEALAAKAKTEKERVEKAAAEKAKADKEKAEKETAEKGKAEKAKYVDPTINSSDTMNVKDPVTICHIPPGNNMKRRTLVISRSALKAHLGHGDIEGDCEGDKKGPKADPKEKPLKDEKAPKGDKKGKGPGARNESDRSNNAHASRDRQEPIVFASANLDPLHFLRYLAPIGAEADTNKVYGTVKATLYQYSKSTTAKGVVSFRIIDAKTGALLTVEKMPGEFVWISEWATFNGDERALSAEQLRLTRLKEQPAPPAQDLFIEFTRPIYDQITTKIRDFYKGY